MTLVKQILPISLLFLTMIGFAQDEADIKKLTEKFNKKLQSCALDKMKMEIGIVECQAVTSCPTTIQKEKLIKHTDFEDSVYKVFLFYVEEELTYASHIEYVIKDTDTLSWETNYYFKNSQTFVVSSHGHRYWNTNAHPEREIMDMYEQVK